MEEGQGLVRPEAWQGRGAGLVGRAESGTATAAASPDELRAQSDMDALRSESKPHTAATSSAGIDAAPEGTAEAATSTPGKDGAEDSNTAKGISKAGRPLEAVLLMDPPRRGQQHPHMAPPPYVHHFDSYSLVKQLQGGGYTEAQATTSMKGIRTLLAQNLDVAQQSLVSKSDVENETYLFTAACSELSTEIKNNRRMQDEHMRQQRTLLQHEVDILTQSLNQELHTLNDNVRGMFNDRRMAVREEQKAVESAIQKINYKMSILLSSDCKSEIEAVRWILIRRSVLGIIFMAILTLGMLRYATYMGQRRKLEAERRAKEEEELRKDGGKTDHSMAADAAAILAAN
ncbi:hypothetical protein HIM_07655 [Hirsutella minnesotensis 3608]|uniref:MOZ protein represents a chromatin-associated acetyltransferase n=1 Tax=Hirsutella minnesotensis 3608 TaxID=1043627 RepID=A0A0F7ZYQ7_9HYPO|nr:hypothetical protein HIM_07655 [Hirsutella minnesotensis 3608]